MDLWDFCNGNPRSPKYLNPNNPQIGWACFVLERWVPAEFYDRTEWDNLRVDNAGDDGKFIDRLGPYKNRGTYILAKPLMTDAYEPLELSQQLLEVLQWGIKQGPLTGEALRKHNTIQRKLKQAREAEVIDKQTAERREWFKSNSERINRMATRHTVSSLAVPDSQSLKNMSRILLPTSLGATEREQHVS